MVVDPAAADAVGWDWAGINLDDGGALMAFQVRAKDGRAIYAGGTIGGRAGSSSRSRRPGALRARRRWRSPASGGSIRSRPSSSCACPKANAASRSGPCSTRRSWTGAAPACRLTGKARSARPAGEVIWSSGYAGDLSL
jgi:hypothetical protein